MTQKDLNVNVLRVLEASIAKKTLMIVHQIPVCMDNVWIKLMIIIVIVKKDGVERIVT